MGTLQAPGAEGHRGPHAQTGPEAGQDSPPIYNSLKGGLKGVGEKDIQRIKELIDEVKKPYVQFGGNVEFFDIKDDKVRIKTTGYCHR